MALMRCGHRDTAQFICKRTGDRYCAECRGDARRKESQGELADLRAQLATRDAQIAELGAALERTISIIDTECDDLELIVELRSALAAIPGAALAEVRRDERERCCTALCPACRDNVPLRGQIIEGEWISSLHWHENGAPCCASAIRALSAEREGDVSDGR